MQRKFNWLYLVVLLLIVFTGCQTVTNAQEVNSFDDCVAAGNPVLESFPEQCRHGDQIFVNEDQTIDVKDPIACTREFRPVCGSVEVQCITAPCDPIRTTFSNRCLAEAEGATDITEGACVDEEPIDLEGACLSADNRWLEDSKECVGMGQEQCENTGGTWNECASACRNNPDAEVCTLQCIVVCQY